MKHYINIRSVVRTMGLLVLLTTLIFAPIFSFSASKKENEPIIENLSQIVKEGNNVQRFNALLELVALKDRKCLQILRYSLKDSSAFVRQAACEGLGMLNSYKPVTDLVRIAQRDENLFVRQEAIRALGRIKDPSCIPALMKMITRKNFFLMEVLEESLLRLGVPKDELEKVEAAASQNW